MPKKQKTFWEGLNKDTKDLIVIFAMVVGVLFLVFVIQNPIAGGLTIISLLIVGGTIYWKINSGNWWFQRNNGVTKAGSNSPSSVTFNNPSVLTPPATQTNVTTSPPFPSHEDQAEAPQSARTGPSLDAQSIIEKIRQFRPQRRVADEKSYQDMLFAFMWGTFPSLEREVPLPNRKVVDARIGEIGLEIKFQPNESEFDRLYSQVESYLDYLRTVIVVVSRPKTPDALNHFEQRLRRRGWLDSQAFIVQQAV